MAQDVFQGEMDPEIAALLGTEDELGGAISDGAGIPSFEDIFSPSEYGEEVEGFGEDGEEETLNLNEAAFPEVTKKLEAVPHDAFLQPQEYYKTVLENVGESGARVHTILQKFLAAKDPKDRGVYRQQLTAAYWEFLLAIARKAPGKLSDPQKYLLRFGVLHPALLDAGKLELLSQIVVENELSQPIYYLDDWFKAVGSGAVRPSTTDEAKIAHNDVQARLQQQLEKAAGKRDGARNLLRAKDEERLAQEKALLNRVTALLETNTPMPDLPEVMGTYDSVQKQLFSEIQDLIRAALKSDRELEFFYRDYSNADDDVRGVQDKIEAGGVAGVNTQAIDVEFDSVRQMAKLTVGRQGNHFPVLIKEYFRSADIDVGFRENILTELKWIEGIDAEAFCRTYKNHLNRIAPYVVLIPSYGDAGICWEPYDRFNRATSRGRLAVPMFPKNLRYALLSAVGDLRWQVTKEKGSFHWMEEGLSGAYFQYFTSHKLKGDLKETFIEDYITWIMKESEGTQKLDKELRGIFWRNIPFAQSIKEKLKTRSYIYQELYQKDVNRAMSDGY